MTNGVAISLKRLQQECWQLNWSRLVVTVIYLVANLQSKILTEEAPIDQLAFLFVLIIHLLLSLVTKNLSKKIKA